VSLISPQVQTLIDAALAEDRPSADYTTLATVPADRYAEGVIVARQALRLCGVAVVAAVFERGGGAIEYAPGAADGDDLEAGAVIARVCGPARELLSLERPALNFLGRLCGVATRARDWTGELRRAWEALPVAARPPLPPRLVDTRKTIPGWRELDKYAVRTGGAGNHRHDLAGGVLIKDNHLIAAGGVEAALLAAREIAPHGLRLEIEVTSLEQLQEALAAGAEACLLDNMEGDELADAVARCREADVISEVSGGVGFAELAALAALGPDVISSGALTHSAPCADIALDFTRSWKTA